MAVTKECCCCIADSRGGNTDWTDDVIQHAGERGENKHVRRDRAVKKYPKIAEIVGFSTPLLVSARRSTRLSEAEHNTLKKKVQLSDVECSENRHGARLGSRHAS